MESTTDRVAVLWERGEGQEVRCFLCSHRCLIAAGHKGLCCVRENREGTLYTLTYDRLCSAALDPIEKKPLFHFLPGTRSFSVATQGCNFQCEFCQNWQISQACRESGQIDGQATGPDEIVRAAVRSGAKSISYTYTEPTVFMELAAECGTLARARGLRNVFVSNGYQTIQAIDYARPWLDAINVDLKAFTEDFYQRLCKARLRPVLDTIRYIARHTDLWIEVTTLLVPGLNDGEDELKALADWLAREAGPHIPWHVSRFYPQYKMTDIEPTAQESLDRAYEIGRAAGLQYVYLGNAPGSKTEGTYCPRCSHLLIDRVGYTLRANRVVDGRCPACGEAVAGVWA